MSDNISTNTIFHFTPSLENLEGILKNDFYPQFVFEDFFGTIANITNAEKAMPMVWFCDIPLSQVGRHIEKYGEYAIGLSKDWAVSKKINPVLYTYKGSDFATRFNKALLSIFAHEEEIGLKDHPFGNELSDAMHYIKPYEGVLWRNGQWTKETIRFYDEREWRYILPRLGTEPSLMIKKDTINASDEELKRVIENLNKAIEGSEHIRLSFRPSDIKFIIVKKESEILSMVDKVISIKREKFSYKDIQILTTRIISMESIRETF